MMTSERLPMAWICVTTSPKRRSAAGIAPTGRRRRTPRDQKPPTLGDLSPGAEEAASSLRCPVQ